MLREPPTKEIIMRSPRLVLTLYVVFAVGNIVASWSANLTLDWATKPLLMPLLALWVWLAGRSRGDESAAGIIAGLLLSAAGDIALLNEGTGWFITGMVLFLGAHVCYIAVFLRHGAWARIRRFPLILSPIGYTIALVAALTWLWRGLAAKGLAIPMTGYGAALATTAALCAALGGRVGLGGGLFLVSDLLIAMGVADAAKIPGPPIWVMVTYCAAQFLIATGWVARERARATLLA
jgi:uncharacterized membrane protein YhhN